MGIRNLTRWVKWMGCMNPTVQWIPLKGTRIGIDVLSLLYKARADALPILQVIHCIVVALREREVEPVFVFDGRSPREKAGTRSARRQQKSCMSEEDQERHRISSDDRNEVKQLLYALGVLCLNAEEEADSVLAFLARRGDISAVVSTDMDFLPRGIRTLIIPNNLTHIHTWTAILLDLAGLRISLDYPHKGLFGT